MPTGAGPLRVRYRCLECSTEGCYDGVPKRDEYYDGHAGPVFDCENCMNSGRITKDDGIQLTGNFERLEVTDRD